MAGPGICRWVISQGPGQGGCKAANALALLREIAKGSPDARHASHRL